MPTTDRSQEKIEQAAARWVFLRESGLPPEKQAEFERWLAADPRHGATLQRQEQAWSTLDRPRRAGQANVLLKKLDERKTQRRRTRLAGLAFALAIGAFALVQLRAPQETITDTRIALLVPERRVLEDGSIVELKTGARITVEFSDAARAITLVEGEAHFQVAHQARPFLVTAGGVEFRAVGTAFNVKLAEAEVGLVVTEGTVAVQTPTVLRTDAVADEPPAVRTVLATVSAGSRIAMAPASTAAVTPTTIRADEMAELMAWRAPRLEFTDTPLSMAVDYMNQQGRPQLVLEDEELGKLLVSGLFRADRVEAFVLILEANFDVKAEQRGDVTYLRRDR
ncbi:MAG TPA: FecR domain-containing protein [Opitutaceae bacterium]